MKCKLCCETQADFKGSHIIPHFLVKTMVNDEGFTSRDKEVSFALDGSFVNQYFGRAVSSDTIKKVLGRDLKEEELKKNINQYTEDYLLCTRCEKRFSYIEDYYSKNGMSFKEYETVIRNNADPLLSCLFWATVVWRIGVTEKYGLELKDKDIRKLRSILNNSLGNSIEETINKSQENKKDINLFGYILLIDLSSDDDSNNFFVAHPNNQMPYSIIVNNHVLFFYAKRQQCGGLIQNFFKLEKLISKIYLNPLDKNHEILISIPVLIRNEARDLLVALKQKQMLHHWEELLIETLKKAVPDLSIVVRNQIVKESIYEYVITPPENNAEVKLTFERLSKVAFKVLSKYVKTDPS
jgi:hypothetical protein